MLESETELEADVDALQCGYAIQADPKMIQHGTAVVSVYRYDMQSGVIPTRSTPTMHRPCSCLSFTCADLPGVHRVSKSCTQESPSSFDYAHHAESQVSFAPSNSRNRSSSSFISLPLKSTTMRRPRLVSGIPSRAAPKSRIWTASVRNGRGEQLNSPR